MAEPPQKKRRPNFTDEELHALIAAVISRKQVLFKIWREKKLNGAIVKKVAGKKNMLVGLINIAI